MSRLFFVTTILFCILQVQAEQHQTVDNKANSIMAKTVLMDSIAIQTVQGFDKVPELALYYSNILKNAGFSDQEIVITAIDDTAMLEATLSGRENGKPILLIGHMDVVAADPDDWERDPFTPVEENGYIYGRGAYDNKFDVAMLVTTLASLKRNGYVPRNDIILLLSGDEETTQISTQALAKRYKNAEMLLNGDAGGGTFAEDGTALYYMLQAGEKSYADFKIEFNNPGGHSSRPSKTNAITQLSNALSRLGAYDFAPQDSELTKASLRGMAPQVDAELGAAMLAFVDDINDSDALATIRNNPEYIGQIGTTCVATMVKAGHAENALPQSATANINCRIFPGQSAAEIKAELKRVVNDPAAKITIEWDPILADASPLRKDVTEAVNKAVHAKYPNIPVIPYMSAYGTDNTYFRALGIPSYGTSGLFIRPSDDFTHGLNERVPVSVIPSALMHWESLILELTQ